VQKAANPPRRSLDLGRTHGSASPARPDHALRRGIERVATAVALAFALAGCGAHPTKPSAPIEKSLQLNATGALVDVGAALVADHVTIVDFWSESCGACKVVGGKVEAEIANEPRIVIRKVDVGDGFTPIAKAYEINALPHYNVYDRLRRLRYVLIANDCLRAPQLARELLAEN
jgi:thiol-disulfide isomerase/thioredoxin